MQNNLLVFLVGVEHGDKDRDTPQQKQNEGSDYMYNYTNTNYFNVISFYTL